MRTALRILVRTYLAIFARLVLFVRRPVIVGVTGSVGKTTTKETIATVLRYAAREDRLGRVGYSHGSLNTEFGLPLAIIGYDESPGSLMAWLGVVVGVPFRTLRALIQPAYPHILVLEYAADRPGDIHYLAALARPTVAVVTEVGPAHLEKFLTLDAVTHEKGQLVRPVSPDGLVILNKDNERVRLMAPLTKAPIEYVAGRGPVLAQAIAKKVAAYFDIPPSVVDKALRELPHLQGRLDIQMVGTIWLIDDTYNANPLSMQLALDTLAEAAPKGVRKVAILGDMLELGGESPTYHKEIGLYAHKRADYIIAIGAAAKAYQGDTWYPDSRTAANAVPDLLKSGDAIVVKASRGIQTEHVVEAIKDWQKQTKE